MTAPVVDTVGASAGFRPRLLEGLATSIAERGYRETTVADVVRHARTSKRTFYDHFATKEQCFVELLTANNEELVAALAAAVDPDAPWRDQVRQAVTAYVQTIDAHPAITLTWIRELPALGEQARPMLRMGLSRLTAMIVALTTNSRFAEAGVEPLAEPAAVILVGGLRELTAQTLEDGAPAAAMIEPAVAAATALLAGR